MILSIRNWFNKNFSDQKYENYKHYFDQFQTDPITFRIAETPIFIPKEFEKSIIKTSELIVDVIAGKGYKAMTETAIPSFINTKNEGSHPHFLVMDYGICKNELSGDLEPRLIELQGFPSLFFYQFYQDEAARAAYNIPDDYQIFFNNWNKETTIELLREVILGEESSKNVILLELFPEKQKTKIDFFFTQMHLGIPIVCVTQVKIVNDHLFYERDGKLIPIHRIYNRVIWDDVVHNANDFVQSQAKEIMSNEYVQWVTHPSWFYRISKFALPFLQHPNIPTAYFLNTFLEPPTDLSKYVQKPLFSFSGHGVVINPTPFDFFNVDDSSQYILQRKVAYEPAILTLDEPAKAEIRVFYIWPEEAPRPILTHNLARLTKADMIGVDFNIDKSWIGGSFAYFGK